MPARRAAAGPGRWSTGPWHTALPPRQLGGSAAQRPGWRPRRTPRARQAPARGACPVASLAAYCAAAQEGATAASTQGKTPSSVAAGAAARRAQGNQASATGGTQPLSRSPPRRGRAPARAQKGDSRWTIRLSMPCSAYRRGSTRGRDSRAW
eukprot:5999021-Pyramimonas_sp.AAC.1